MDSCVILGSVEEWLSSKRCCRRSPPCRAPRGTRARRSTGTTCGPPAPWSSRTHPRPGLARTPGPLHIWCGPAAALRSRSPQAPVRRQLTAMRRGVNSEPPWTSLWRAYALAGARAIVVATMVVIVVTLIAMEELMVVVVLAAARILMAPAAKAAVRRQVLSCTMHPSYLPLTLFPRHLGDGAAIVSEPVRVAAGCHHHPLWVNH